MGKKAADDHRPTDPETEEKKRLRSLAISRRLLRRDPACPSTHLEPSKFVVKLDGRDIVKRGQRRSRYLFSFPGLLAPVSGGRIGELAELSTKNPVLYLEFPQGRMKLFGTHVYPKNKYLTLQLTKSSKGVMCEDCFESMIVFSDAWWIGRKEENPEELRLEFPEDLKMDKSTDYDFKGGAGGSPEGKYGGSNTQKEVKIPSSPDTSLEDQLPDDSDPVVETNNAIGAASVRQSARAAGKTINYAELSHGNDSLDDDAEITEMIDEKIEDDESATISKLGSTSKSNEAKSKSVGKLEHSPLLSKEPESSSTKGALVQATLSTLFEKVAEKKSKRKAHNSPGPKGSGGKRIRSSPVQLANQMPVKESKKKAPISFQKNTGMRKDPLQKQFQVEDDEIEDISSESQDLSTSDEDWAG